ncbi:GNAT family N-acetyltransferase [Imtechella halotolerans]|uniref:N-acetyltransferase GCN5 n=1 Tax=Imtechella halotolerans K1 TaxID=946077 RepID=I0WE90_9FLAO|nr:N-acetyltransferase GCN5 [Imtechella halotolerans K1]
MITITQVDQGRKGYFLAQEDTNEAGRMTYTWAGTGKFIIDHTEVNSDFSGRGVGKKMVMQAVLYARENDLKILPLCPFAKSVFDKDTTIHDVLFK